MNYSVRKARILIGGFLVTAVLAACQITGAWHFVDNQELLSHPTSRHSAVTRNHEFVLAQQSVGSTIQLFETNGAHLDSVNLGGAWRSAANATYRGEPLEEDGRMVDGEAFLVLHSNGWIIPWYHSRGQLVTAPFDKWVKMPAVQRGHSRGFIDIDQHRDGTIYVLTSERGDTEFPHGRIWKRDLDGEWSFADKGKDGRWLYKVKSLAVDKQLGSVAVASEPGNNIAHIDVFDLELGPKQQLVRENTRSIMDMDYFLGHFYFGVLDVVALGDFDFIIEIRDPSWNVTHVRDVDRVEAVALDLPPLPATSKGYHNVYLWSTGLDTDPADGKFKFLHRYELRP